VTDVEVLGHEVTLLRPAERPLSVSSPGGPSGTVAPRFARRAHPAR
jgi:hypothetical protein